MNLLLKLAAWAFYGVSVSSILAYSVVSEGFALMCMWDWFLSEPFGIVRIGMWHAAGIAGIIGLVSHQFRSVGKDSGTSKAFMVHTLLDPWARLATAWTIHTVMVSL